MSLHWGGEFLDQVLSPTLRSKKKQIEVDPKYDASNDTGFIMCNGETAEVILIMAGVSPRRVSREKLRSLLSEELDIQVCACKTMAIRTQTDDCSMERGFLRSRWQIPKML